MSAFGGTAEHDGQHGVPGPWIGHDAATRRRNRWWTGALTLVFAGLAVALTEPRDRWWWAGTVGVCWLGSLCRAPSPAVVVMPASRRSLR